MNQIYSESSFNSIKPSGPLEDFVHMYWEKVNFSDKPFHMTIFPDSYFKLIVEIQNEKIIAFFLTGLWTKEIDVVIPPNTKVYGIKFKLLAAEYIFQQEIALILQSIKNLNSDFWNIQEFYSDTFENYVRKIESHLISVLENKKVQKHKIQLSELLYAFRGDISAEEVSKQINWSNRQMNRYLNKYLGVSLKTYLNIQKCYYSYFQIREGEFYPQNNYYDQPHFIREIKKHTGNTPTQLYKKQNDRFIQLKNIRK